MNEILKNNTNSFFKKAGEIITLTKERAMLLDQIAEKIAAVWLQNKEVNINFICTHNSRRSQLGQVWAFFAIEYFNLKNMFSFSGGTEVTAFHRNTVNTLREVGFNFSVEDFSHQNPIYNITFEGTEKAILGFSKVYDNSENKQPFIVITTCNSADANCPFIPEAIARFHLPFVDPKFSDNSNKQQKTYLKTNTLIAAEVFFLFKKVKELIS